MNSDPHAFRRLRLKEKKETNSNRTRVTKLAVNAIKLVIYTNQIKINKQPEGLNDR